MDQPNNTQTTTPTVTGAKAAAAAAMFRSLMERLGKYQFLTRGESMIGSVGIVAGAILLTMIGLAGWWTARGEQDALRTIREQQVRVLGNVLSQSAESMLINDELSSLRRLLVQSKQEHELSSCRIVLPDGRVIADADPTKITIVALPPKWPSGPVDQGIASINSSSTDTTIQINQPLLVRGRGAAMLCISASPAVRGGGGGAQFWQTSAGVGLIGAFGLMGMLLVYRHMRTKVMTLALIRESLLAAQEQAGSSSSRDALALRDDLGPEAAAWNHLLAENDSLRKASVAERVKDSLAGGGGGSTRAVVRDTTSAATPAGRSDLEHACDALSVGMVVVDELARVKHANGAAAVLLQAKRDQMFGHDINALIDDAAVKEVITTIVGGSGQRKTLEIKRSETQGGGILRVHVRPMRRDDAGGALITIEDVTQQRVADAARNSFVAQATHELRTPLTNMRLCLEDALENQDADPKIMREHFNVLNQETRRLERMVGEMLSVAQIEAGSLTLKRDDVRLDTVFDELQADYKPQAAEKQLTLSFELPPKFPVIQGDRDKLMVTLHNLLGNALKYTPAGGKVSVSVRADTAHLTVDINDTGIGVSPDEQAKLFQKFYRANDTRVAKISGTGLGLALAREIARLHNGDVTLQSELNKGSTFTLTLPIVLGATKTTKQAA